MIKPATDNMTEGMKAFSAFKNAMRKLVSVPHLVIQEREAEYKQKSAVNPNRRGPKPQPTDDGMDDLVAQMREKRSGR